MSYKTHPTVNRVKHTMGWQDIAQTSLTDFRNLLFLKSWLKLKQWYFMNLQQFTNYKFKLLFITALRRPKRNSLRNKIVPGLHKIEDETFDIQDALQFQKKISWIPLHYKNRKKLFNFIKIEKSIRQGLKKNKEIGTLTSNVITINPIKWGTNLQKMKNSWLYFAQTANFKNFFVKHKFYKHFLNLKYINYNLVKTKEKMYGIYDESFLGWERMSIKIKNMKKKKRKILFSFGRILKISKKLKSKTKEKKDKKSLTKLENNIISYIRNKCKIKKLKIKTAHRKYSFKFFENLTKELEISDDIVLHEFRDKYKMSLKKVSQLKRQWRKNKRYFHLYKKLQKKQKITVFKNKKKLDLLKYSSWKKNYIFVLNERTDMINEFLDLVKYLRNYKKRFKPEYKKNLQRFRKVRKKIFKSERFKEVKQRTFLIKKKKNNEKNGFNKKRKRLSFKWRAIANINDARKIEKLENNKSKINNFRINYIFKQIIKFVLNKSSDKNGKLVIRFLQPIGLLMSTAKVRRYIARDIKFRRYRRNKLYKKFIPILASLSRYWDPQPMLQQIAYEMQKTKKHWPLLKTIREMFKILKPTIFSGYRFSVHGKISSSDRTRVFFFKQGKMPLSNFNSKILYSIWYSNARTGVFSIRGWLYFSSER